MMSQINYTHLIAQLSAAKNAFSTEAARLSSIGDKETAKKLWAEEDFLVSRIDILMAEEQKEIESSNDGSFDAFFAQKI